MIVTFISHGTNNCCRDLYAVIRESTLLPTFHEEPADYTPVSPKTLEDRDATIEDICDFVVEYINSDVLVRA